jgi:hypothetical protein
MPGWSIVAMIHGAVLLLAALLMPIRRRAVAASASVAYVLIAAAGAGLASWWWGSLLTPGVLLVAGYWLSGFFFRDPQRWLEWRLLSVDRTVFQALRIDSWLERAPGWVLEALEGSYAGVYLVVGGGAVAAAAAGPDDLNRYWTLVLASELFCYAMLPWLRSRPPRVLEPPGLVARRRPALRRLNEAILDRASVQANTLPSGHVAGPAASALALLAIDPALALVAMIAAATIGLAAVVGRYHYVVDCAAGALVALLVWSLG